jgi:hypothetical protein
VRMTVVRRDLRCRVRPFIERHVRTSTTPRPRVALAWVRPTGFLLSIAAFQSAASQTVSDPGRAIGWSQAGPMRSAETCAPGRTALMILGSYHMSNPGLDTHNIRVDDVRSPHRQAEIREVVKALGRFHPTKVAIESPFKGSGWRAGTNQSDMSEAARYTAYLQGRYELASDEREQIGFRLARQAGLAAISPVDYPMFMNGVTPNEIADSALARTTATPMASTRPLTPEEQLFRESTVAVNLVRVNSDTSIVANASSYPSMLLPDTTTTALYAGADLVANWYKRNLRIFSNLARITDFGKDRVLLVIGAGHIHILSDLALTSSYYCLVSPLDYLPRN